MNATMFLISILLSILVLLSNNPANGKRILLILPLPSYSHHIVFRGLTTALLERGHEIVVGTTNPNKNTTIINYREIDLSHFYKLLRNSKVVTVMPRYLQVPQEVIHPYVLDFMLSMSVEFFKSPEVQKLCAADSNEKFDAVIVESVSGYSFYSLAHRFNAPLIGIFTMDLNVHLHYSIGSPILPSHPHNWEYSSSTGFNLPFWQRVMNFVRTWNHIRRWENHVEKEDKIVKKFFGNETPHIKAIQKNMSLMLVNSNPATSYPIPTPPNLVMFHGFHIAKTPPILPKKLKSFLDTATDGFIYMSLGTNAKSSDLPPNAIEVIRNAFSKLPYKILWKYEEELPNKPINVFTSKWIPQQGVLAHPNIKLFVSQGGQQSIEEAVYYAVPVVGIPIMFDQGYRILKMQSLGTGRLLPKREINDPTFYNTIYDVASNPMYKEKMKEVSSLFKDTPYDHMENVIWWIEHVMRHKGARHLRFSGLDEPWYQRYDMDVIAAVSIIIFISMLLLVTLLVRCSLWCVKRTQLFSRFLNDGSSSGKNKKVD